MHPTHQAMFTGEFRSMSKQIFVWNVLNGVTFALSYYLALRLMTKRWATVLVVPLAIVPATISMMTLDKIIYAPLSHGRA